MLLLHVATRMLNATNARKKGHLAHACRSTFKARKPTPQHLRQNSSQSMHQLTQEDTVEDTTHLMFNLLGNQVKPRVASLTVEGAELRMEVDTSKLCYNSTPGSIQLAFNEYLHVKCKLQ